MNKFKEDKSRPTMKFFFYYCLLFFSLTPISYAQSDDLILVPKAVFDGTSLHEGWKVWIKGNQIHKAAKRLDAPAVISRIELKGLTLLPGLIEGHSHILLHPYNETSWNDQVLKESQAERVIRATLHVKRSLEAGITTMRDLGSEGAAYADVGVKQAIEQGIIPGPRLLVAGRAIVATGSYGPKGFAPEWEMPLGAEAADGQNLVKVVRDQIGKGADIVKVYADYRWGPNGEARPTFSIEELKLIVETAASSGRPVVAHAASAEGMYRATMAGVQTIEHGDGGTEEVFRLMTERGVALCPTIAAGDAIMQYRGWHKERDPLPARIQQKQESFRIALEAKTPIVFGGDVGVFPHGDNVRELEMMVIYGMTDLAVLQHATAGNADILQLDDRGKIEAGRLADLIAVEGDPSKDISVLRKLKWVMKDGQVYVDKQKE